MRIHKINPTTLFSLLIFAFACAAAVSSARAEIVWSGPNTTFTQDAATPEDVLVPGAVSIVRAPASYLYNAEVDLGAGDGTPTDTEWAFGTMADHNSLNYEPFSQIHGDAVLAGQHLSTYLTQGPMVLRLINEGIFISVTFNSWEQGPGGSTFTYTRSTPAVAAPPPTVNITVPTNNAVFAAPANVSITASASVSSGSVTNVQFFAGANLLGSKQTAPFTVTANGLSVGSYALKAVATAGGISATSAPVNISVVTPVTTSLSAAQATVNNQFVFSYSSTPGLRYEVDISSNLFNWTPVSTNVAIDNPSFFTNPISGGGNYYRVGRLPNP
jgi:hypothetical protein